MKSFITRNKQKGFTLIEAMVAISVLSLAITGPMIIAQKGIASAVYSKDEITAFYLAQEAVEYVRNVRDTNRITAAPWLSYLNTCIDTGLNQKCQIDARYADFTNVLAIQSCSSGTCSLLSYDSTNSVYGYGTGPTWKPTKFTRTISLDTRASDKEVMMTVNITWATNLFAPLRTFSIKEYLFNF